MHGTIKNSHVFDEYNFKQVFKLRASICTSKLNSNCNRRVKCCKEIKERNVERQKVEGKPTYEAKDRLRQITKKRIKTLNLIQE